ncbi:MAG: zf-HC2 domain-containing protein [Burkholderiales bacterium]|uniref:zf-HC2 domain-containing protein n=1 Tax=Nitrosomonas sp. TaxID=42353 RepID=UPI001DD4B112|nr:zf-HC2 domain-containing protein [Nitrosomonas sp.]MCB1950037.1 zf-HC2 domain-containing protein [Nitrosomonas sp.]MCP5244404.1 zf-HC2 domain-containing protein [Burkholderiales bacterium]
MSVNSKINSNHEHREVWSLLPWFINRTLNATEQARVESHIKTCITCRIELKQQRQVYDNIQQAELMQQMSNASFNQLKKRIETQPVSQLALFRKKLDNFQKLFFQFPFSRKSFALAFGVLLVTTTFIFNAMHEQTLSENEYRTLAQSSAPLQESKKPNLIRVIFTDETDAAQIDTIVSGVYGHIVNGPYKNGVYEILIDGEQKYSMETTDAISALRNNTHVIFAELAHVQLSSE